MNNNIKKLYKDALYMHLLNKGYPEYKAKVISERMMASYEE